MVSNASYHEANECEKRPGLRSGRQLLASKDPKKACPPQCIPPGRLAEALTKVEVPSWDDAEEKFYAGTADPIEEFVHNNEPAGKSRSVQFRAELKAALEHAIVVAWRTMDRPE
jgi:hypothetical protein